MISKIDRRFGEKLAMLEHLQKRRYRRELLTERFRIGGGIGDGLIELEITIPGILSQERVKTRIVRKRPIPKTYYI